MHLAQQRADLPLEADVVAEAIGRGRRSRLEHVGDADVRAPSLGSRRAIAFIALFLAHGVNLGTATALVSTLASLAITALLAWIFVWASELTGLADESVGFLDALGTSIDPRGLLLAGIMIGALGVLDDVTVTQVSAVWELKRATPSAGPGELYRRGVADRP